MTEEQKIDKLTPEQEEEMPKYVEKWTKIGLCCDPLNFEASKEASCRAYKEAELEPPKYFFQFQSPISAAVGGYLIKLFFQSLSKVEASVNSNVLETTSLPRKEKTGRIESPPSTNEFKRIKTLMTSGLGEKISRSVEPKTIDKVVDEVRIQIFNEVIAPLGNGSRLDTETANVFRKTWAMVVDDLTNKDNRETQNEVWEQVRAQVWGSHDAAGLSFYDFFLNVVGLECCRRLEPLMDIAKNCGWWAPYEGYVIFQDRHQELHRDERNRIHNMEGPAIMYPDGFSVYAVHGVRVNRDLIEKPETNTVEAIRTEENAEIRRIRIEIYGFENYLRDDEFEKQAQDDFGTLWRKKMPGDEPDLVMCEVINSTPEPDGTNKHYVLPCRSDVRTPHEAVSQSFGLTPERYNPEKES